MVNSCNDCPKFDIEQRISEHLQTLRNNSSVYHTTQKNLHRN